MTLNRALATAVVAAVTAPVVLAAAAPAFAHGTPVTQAAARPSASGDENVPTYEDLEKAAATAKTAYDDAVVAESEGRKEVEATMKALESESHPLNKAWRDAEKVAKDAAEAKDAADQDVTDAKAALEAAGSEAEKAEAQKALDAAETAQAEAVEALETARGKAKAARTELDDARVAATRKYHLVKKALSEARTAKEAADKALAEARECVRDNALTSAAVGLPAKVVAGESVGFTFRITNGGTRTLSVDPLAGAHLKDARLDEALKVEWSDGSAWHALDQDEGAEHLGRIDELKPGARSEVKMRLTVDAKAVGKGAKNAEGFALFAADAFDAYKPCVLGPMKRYDFEVLPVGSEPGDVDDAKPGKPGSGDDERPGPGGTGTEQNKGTSAQGGAGASAKSGADGKAGGEAGGDLAETGASSATLPLALAGAGAVAVGAGAVFVVRRRRAAAQG
ncbi:LAETG motif-containing sortase-dependent surface protein [Streptomyces sp. LHD-70]|uniref:LAETG motif-containing sortase-dependent surface protein n=1 Tax=Streptomyces sp. LHD-70 TaxID=3072140 RepID=UPI00280E12D4|nr:LAETG motif-containing sortase-dependent surface protein [Streptomyces sp. LHD-70]MDQ8702807.1 LAETG motif-containing sortase-dependent surface protein [Streptomyces sp. LHD-70]